MDIRAYYYAEMVAIGNTFDLQRIQCSLVVAQHRSQSSEHTSTFTSMAEAVAVALKGQQLVLQRNQILVGTSHPWQSC